MKQELRDDVIIAGILAGMSLVGGHVTEWSANNERNVAHGVMRYLAAIKEAYNA